MPSIIASTGGVSYEVKISNNALSQTGKIVAPLVRGRRAFIVTDENVAKYYLSPVIASLEDFGFGTQAKIITPGESSKNSGLLLELYYDFNKFSLTRQDLVIALGGGVVGDLAGFAAATYLRGVPLVQIPTTLLAQVDSSVGGKTAIDLPFGKNLAGAFHQPSAVIIDPSVLKTLPRSVMNDGMAEVIKSGCIKDSMLFEAIESGRIDLEWMIERCIRLKTSVVANDERDKGERMLLNFGHTIGHAIEKATGYSDVTHGQGVAIGMVTAALAGEALGITKFGTAERIKKTLGKFSLPISTTIPYDELKAAIKSDKKTLSDNVYFVLLREIGESVLYPMDSLTLDRVLEEALRNA